MIFTLIILVILNSNYWLCFILIFYALDSKIHIIYAIPFIFIFLVRVVTSSYPAVVSLFFFQQNGVVSPSPLLIVIFHHFSLCFSFLMSATTRWFCWLYWKYLAERSYHCYISFFFSEHNGVISLSPLLIFIFWSFLGIPPHGWVRPLVHNAAYIGSTFLIHRIIAINCHCFYPRIMASFHCHRCWLLYFDF